MRRGPPGTARNYWRSMPRTPMPEMKYFEPTPTGADGIPGTWTQSANWKGFFEDADTNGVTAYGDYTGTMLGIDRGTNQSQRIGYKIVVRKILMNGCVIQTSPPLGPLNQGGNGHNCPPNYWAGGDYPLRVMPHGTQQVRCILVLDKSPNGSVLASNPDIGTDNSKTAICGNTGVFATSNNYIDAFRNLTTAGRYVILKEWWVTITNIGSSTAGNGYVQTADTAHNFIGTGSAGVRIRCAIDCNLPVRYDDQDGGKGYATAIRENNLSFFFCARHRSYDNAPEDANYYDIPVEWGNNGDGEGDPNTRGVCYVQAKWRIRYMDN